MFLVPARRNDPEIMDRTDNSATDLDCALRDLRTINRLLGGRRALLEALSPYLEEAVATSPVEVLDVGTGSGDLPVAMIEHARKLGRSLRVTGLELDPTTAAIATRCTAGYPEIRIVHGDARALPFARGSFDVVTASLFLHHFEFDDVAHLLREFRRVARLGVLINDLHRHRVPWGFIALAARAARFHPMIVHDGPLSVLRGFTPAELRRVARTVGARGAIVRRRWPYRLVLTLPGAEAA